MIIAVDFDGTLCENAFPAIGKPKQNVIDYIKKQQEEATIILWTCRQGILLKRAERWCREQGIRLDYINKNAPSIIKLFNGDCRKIFANIYIDDKSLNAEDI